MMSNMDKSVFYTNDTASPGTAPLHVEMAGEQYCLPAYHIRRTQSSVGVLCCVVDGCGTIRIHHREYEAGGGDVFILEKGSRHEYYVDPGSPWHILWFNVDGDLLSVLIREYGLINEVVFRHAGDLVGEIFRKGLRCCLGCENPEQVQKKLALIITEIIIELASAFRGNTQNNSRDFQIIKGYLDNALSRPRVEPLGLDRMSAELGISKKQITRICKAEMQCTPYDYYMQRKISLARQYLQNTSMSVREISLRLGFCDPYYFSNFFKRKTGTRPREYKQAALARQDHARD